MQEEANALEVVTGRVKWFDPVKGFGFIVIEDVEGHILLSGNVLRNYGQSSVADGAGISVRVKGTQRGVQAVEVLSIEPPETAGLQLAEGGEFHTPEEIAARPMEPARVKWFDRSKGFGFANVFGRSGDVFIHGEVLRLSGFSNLEAGEAIVLRIIEGKRGLMAVQLVPWEAAAPGPAC